MGNREVSCEVFRICCNFSVVPRTWLMNGLVTAATYYHDPGCKVCAV